MRSVFADASGLIALRDSGDGGHGAATAWLGEALSSGGLRLVLTNYVLAEVHAFFCRTPSVALAYVEKITGDPRFQVVRAGLADEAAAWALLKRAPDRDYSFVDAVSFAVMRRLRISEALAFDKHFRQAGFRVVV
ncbi:MAG: PIN domain-containing protein [Elusimicrobia bacterium]|nr:PIN domain-containing protein [Elusimicrobiota bacterium]